MDKPPIADDLDRFVYRNVAKQVLTSADPDDADCADQVQFADHLLKEAEGNE